eukprot:363781-Chlamydomonas_euryale.AAC.22
MGGRHGERESRGRERGETVLSRRPGRRGQYSAARVTLSQLPPGIGLRRHADGERASEQEGREPRLHI